MKTSDTPLPTKNFFVPEDSSSLNQPNPAPLTQDNDANHLASDIKRIHSELTQMSKRILSFLCT